MESLPAEPQGKPKNTGVGSLFPLQRIFLIQESNWGLLHCRRILYRVIREALKVKVAQSCPTLCYPMDSTVHGILQARIMEWVDFPFSKGSSHPGIEPRSPSLQTDSLPAEPQGKPKNTGVGSLFLLQGIFPPRDRTQVSHIAGRFFTS